MKGVFRMIDEERLQNAIREIIIALGDDPERDGLKDTPRRAAEMYIEQFEGMNYTNDELVKALKLLRNIEKGIKTGSIPDDLSIEYFLVQVI